MRYLFSQILVVVKGKFSDEEGNGIMLRAIEHVFTNIKAAGGTGQQFLVQVFPFQIVYQSTFTHSLFHCCRCHSHKFHKVIVTIFCSSPKVQCNAFISAHVQRDLLFLVLTAETLFQGVKGETDQLNIRESKKQGGSFV